MRSTVLEFNHVSFSYPNSTEPTLRDISFAISKGERVALVGLNGSGKSTLLLHTNGLLFPTEGTVEVEGDVVNKKNVSKARQTVGIVFQNADNQLFMPTVKDDVAFGPRNMGLSNDEVARRVDDALNTTGCLHLRDRVPFQLSGGQKRMVAIATVLSMGPQLIVLDEPTANLDYAARKQFLDTASSLPHAIFMASHDLDALRQLCTRAILLEKGTIAYDGPIESLPYPPEK